MARRKSRVEKTTFDQQMEKLNRQASARQRKKRNTDRKVVRTTVYVYEDQWKLLGRRAGQSKADDNEGINRAEVLRALIDFFIELKPNLKDVSSEEQLVEKIKEESANGSKG